MLMLINSNKTKGRYTKLNISDIRIKLVEQADSKLKAVASITIDECFVIHDIKVINGEKGIFISMPAKKSPDGKHKDIAHPIKTETRKELEEKIIEAYNNAPRA